MLTVGREKESAGSSGPDMQPNWCRYTVQTADLEFGQTLEGLVFSAECTFSASGQARANARQPVGRQQSRGRLVQFFEPSVQALRDQRGVDQAISVGARVLETGLQGQCSQC